MINLPIKYTWDYTWERVKIIWRGVLEISEVAFSVPDLENSKIDIKTEVENELRLKIYNQLYGEIIDKIKEMQSTIHTPEYEGLYARLSELIKFIMEEK